MENSSGYASNIYGEGQFASSNIEEFLEHSKTTTAKAHIRVPDSPSADGFYLPSAHSDEMSQASNAENVYLDNSESASITGSGASGSGFAPGGAVQDWYNFGLPILSTEQVLSVDVSLYLDISGANADYISVGLFDRSLPSNDTTQDKWWAVDTKNSGVDYSDGNGQVLIFTMQAVTPWDGDLFSDSKFGVYISVEDGGSPTLSLAISKIEMTYQLDSGDLITGRFEPTGYGASATTFNPSTEQKLRFDGAGNRFNASDFTLGNNSTEITVLTAGTYFASLDLPTEVNNATIRTNIRARLKVNGTLVEGMGGSSGYIRNGSGDTRGGNSFSGLIEIAANDVVTVEVINYSTSASENRVLNASDKPAFSLIKVDDQECFAATMADKDFNNATLDYSSLTATGITSADITVSGDSITLVNPGQYLVMLNIGLASATGQKVSPKFTVEEGGVNNTGMVAQQTYIRGIEHTESSGHFIVFVETSTSNVVLKIADERNTTITDVTNIDSSIGSRVSIIKLPGDRNIALGGTWDGTATTNTNDDTYVASFENQLIYDSSIFTHDNSSAGVADEITVKESGWYLIYALQAQTSSTLRVVPGTQVRVNGLPVGNNQTSYIRAHSGHNNSSTQLAFVKYLTANDVVSLHGYQGGATGTSDDTHKIGLWRLKADLVFTENTKTVSAKASIKVSDNNKNFTTLANIIPPYTEYNQSISVKGNIRNMPYAPTLVAPANLDTSITPVEFIWDMPIDPLGRGMHFHIMVDGVDGNFNNIETEAFSFQGSEVFEYWNGSTWVPIPIDGVDPAYQGNQAKVTLNLIEGSKFWRVRAGVI